MAEEQAWRQGNLSTNRLEALTDGVFAFAMTLLVLNLQFPDTALETGIPLSELIVKQLPRLYNYFLSFVLLAVFWIVHNQHFHHIKKTDRSLLWINIGLLSFIALIPFSTDLVGDFPGQTIAEAFFAGNMFLIGLFFLLNWYYATGGNRFIGPELKAEHIQEGIVQNVIAPAVALIALALAFISPGNSSYAYLLIPAILTSRNLVKKREK